MPSGMTAKLSCELPKTDPFFLLTPTTRKCSAADLDHLVERIDRSEQLVGDLPAEHGHRPARVDFGRADQPSALDVERGEVDVVARDAADLHALDRLVAVADARVRPPSAPRPRRRCRCSAATAAASLQGDPRIVAHPLLVGFRPHDRHALNREVVGADVRDDGVGDVGVHPLDQRHDGDDRRDRDDVAEHGQERAELVRPDRLQRDGRRLEELVHCRRCAGERASPVRP